MANVILTFNVFLYFRYDTAKDNFLDIQELKLMMEKLGAPQTHMALKEMIREVDEDQDNKINFREVSYQIVFRGRSHVCGGGDAILFFNNSVVALKIFCTQVMVNLVSLGLK